MLSQRDLSSRATHSMLVDQVSRTVQYRNTFIGPAHMTTPPNQAAYWEDTDQGIYALSGVVAAGY